MRNVLHEIKGDKLIITVDISQKSLKQATVSSTGKTRLIASTQGNQMVGDGITVGLNVYTKKLAE